MIINISGYSGSGKTALVSYLQSAHPEHYRCLVTYTSRPRRKGEIDGRSYYFVSPQFDFKKECILVRVKPEGTYGVRKQDLLDDRKVVLITFPPGGVTKLKKLGYPVSICFYLRVGFLRRVWRMMIKRKDRPLDIVRRLLDDMKKPIQTSAEITRFLNGKKSVKQIADEVHRIVEMQKSSWK